MSRLVWQYEGANVEKHGEQCVFVGDKVHHDILGEGIAVRIDGGMIIIEFLEDGADPRSPSSGALSTLMMRTACARASSRKVSRAARRSRPTGSR
jgi:hypothetical protein